MRKLYPLLFQVIVPSLGMEAVSFQIVEDSKTLKLCSIFFDVRLWDPTANLVLPLATQTSQQIALTIGAGGPGSVGNILKNFASLGGGAIEANGAAIRMNTPGQLQLDSGYVRNLLQFQYAAVNFDPANNITHYVSVAVEADVIEST